jgi:hypothetical protein
VHPARDRYRPRRGREDLPRAHIARPGRLAGQPVPHRVLVDPELPGDRPVTQASLVQNLDRHHFLPS